MNPSYQTRLNERDVTSSAWTVIHVLFAALVLETLTCVGMWTAARICW